MKRLKRLAVYMAMLCAVAVASDARSLAERQTDSLISSHKIVYIDGRPDEASTQAYVDSIRQRISLFYYDQFRHFSDPAAPYFLFMSKDAQLAMGIGGCVRMRAYYDWDGAMPSPAFAPYLIPMSSDMTRMRQFGTTPAGTSLFFRVLGRNKSLGDYQLYIEANFNGYQTRDFHLKKAYAIINDFTVGYAASTFSDPAALPPTVDAQGPNNKISPTAVLVRYMHPFKNRWTVALSAETPATALADDNDKTAACTAWMPDFAAFMQYAWSDAHHVRLSAILRTLSYRDLVNTSNHDVVGWGVQLSSVASPVDCITTYATVNYGNGIGSLGGDLQMGDYDLVPREGHPGHLYAPASFGWCAGVQYNIRPDLFVSLSASQNRYLPDHTPDGSEYKYGIFGDVNVFWNITPRIQLGAEFDMGIRKNFNGDHRQSRRIGAMCQFSF